MIFITSKAKENRMNKIYSLLGLGILSSFLFFLNSCAPATDTAPETPPETAPETAPESE